MTTGPQIFHNTFLYQKYFCELGFLVKPGVRTAFIIWVDMICDRIILVTQATVSLLPVKPDHYSPSNSKISSTVVWVSNAQGFVC